MTDPEEKQRKSQNVTRAETVNEVMTIHGISEEYTNT